jgi:hypothetical protein
MPSPLYLGSMAILRPRDLVPSAVPATTDPAQALADAWRLAGEGNRHGVPHVYALARSGQALAVAGDVHITAGLVAMAMEIKARGAD